MQSLAQFHFIRPLWLLLIPVACWVAWWVRRRSDPLAGWQRVMAPELLEAMTLQERARVPVREVMLLSAWSLSIVAVAGPTWKPEPAPFADDPVPVMVVLKANESTDLGDLAPSRIERARLKIADFAQARAGQPLGLIAYAGSAHLVLPPTRDTSVVSSMAAEISSNMMPKQGDDLAAALKLAKSALGPSGGSVVIVADTLVIDEATARRIAMDRVALHILAIARADTPELDALQKAANALGASVTRMTAGSEDVTSLVKQTARVPVAVAATGDGTRWAEAGWWLTPWLALLALANFRRIEATPVRETLR